MPATAKNPDELDALVIGAGFSGAYMLYQLRSHGYRVKLLEAGSELGGVWYWNRYPGARCDTHTPNYEFSMEECWKNWTWTERFPTWGELMSYFRHVDKVLDLSRDIRYDSLVTAARFDDDGRRWHVQCEDGHKASARFLVPCLGFGTKPYVPDLPGLDRFEGRWLHTAHWPHDGSLSLDDKRVGVVGTGASGVQVAQEAARVSSHLTVFQRTPNLAIAMQQEQLDPLDQQKDKGNYPEQFRLRAESDTGEFDWFTDDRSTLEVSDEERNRIFEDAWSRGGLRFWHPFEDTMRNVEANRLAYRFWRSKVLPRIRDPEVAEKLAPRTPPHPFGTKRPSLEMWYFDIFNQDNVVLVDAKDEPIVEVTAMGVRTARRRYDLDLLVLATGFDAGTGGITAIDIYGTASRPLKEIWKTGVVTQLGMGVPGFPNMILLYGPQSPCAFWNGPASAEQQGDWVVRCLNYLRDNGMTRIEATAEAGKAWTRHMKELADSTLLPKADSWYMGANVPGKPIQLLHHIGVREYIRNIEECSRNGYSGFVLN